MMWVFWLAEYKIYLFPKRKVEIWELMLKDTGITEEELGKINASMLILYADNDTIKEEHILKMSQLIKNCKIKKIENSNHLNIYKRNETINEILKYINMT
jgi:pimeloyl-ACP methyl ester carboxylesterase